MDKELFTVRWARSTDFTVGANRGTDSRVRSSTGHHLGHVLRLVEERNEEYGHVAQVRVAFGPRLGLGVSRHHKWVWETLTAHGRITDTLWVERL